MVHIRFHIFESPVAENGSDAIQRETVSKDDKVTAPIIVICANFFCNARWPSSCRISPKRAMHVEVKPLKMVDATATQKIVSNVSI